MSTALTHGKAPADVSSVLVLPSPKRNSFELMPPREQIADMMEMSKYFAMGTGFMVPKIYDKPSKIFIAGIRANELRVPWLVFLQHSFVTGGKVEMSGQLMMGIICARDRAARWKWTMSPSHEGAEVELYRGGYSRLLDDGTREEHFHDSQFRVSIGRWTKDEATRSRQLIRPKRKVVLGWNVNNRADYAKDDRGNFIEEEYDDNWQLWPSRMFSWAAVKIAARLGAPDLINAIAPIDAVSEIAEIQALDKGFTSPANLPALTDPDAVPGGEPEETYIWLNILRPMLLKERLLIQDIDRVVGGGEQDEVNERIEEWLFSGPDVTDLAVRCRELVNEILALRPKGEQSRFDEAPA